MSEMVDRITKILYDYYGDPEDKFYVAEWEDGARAILTDMRESTREMIDKGDDCLCYVMTDDAKTTWQAMIDEALK